MRNIAVKTHQGIEHALRSLRRVCGTSGVRHRKSTTYVFSRIGKEAEGSIPRRPFVLKMGLVRLITVTPDGKGGSFG